MACAWFSPILQDLLVTIIGHNLGYIPCAMSGGHIGLIGLRLMTKSQPEWNRARKEKPLHGQEEGNKKKNLGRWFKCPLSGKADSGLILSMTRRGQRALCPCPPQMTISKYIGQNLFIFSLGRSLIVF